MSERIAPDEHLDELMNTRVKPALGVVPERVRFRTTSAQVFNALYADFMKPVTHIGKDPVQKACATGTNEKTML